MNTRTLQLASLVVIACSLNLASASVTPISRLDFVQAQSVVGRRNGPGNPTNEIILFSQTQERLTVTSLTADLSANSSGTLFDTATGAQLVATGEASINLHSVATLSGSDLAAFEFSGHIDSTITTGTLAGYNPPGGGTQPYAMAQTYYASQLGMTITTSTPYTLTIGLADAVGVTVNRALFYLDSNNDGHMGFGEPQIASLNIVGNNVQSASGMLARSAAPYRVEFVGGLVDEILSDNSTLTDSVNFSGSLALPEPSSLTLALAPPAMIVKRRHR